MGFNSGFKGLMCLFFYFICVNYILLFELDRQKKDF